jgi:hypothetical protein
VPGQLSGHLHRFEPITSNHGDNDDLRRTLGGHRQRRRSAESSTIDDYRWC